MAHLECRGQHTLLRISGRHYGDYLLIKMLMADTLFFAFQTYLCGYLYNFGTHVLMN